MLPSFLRSLLDGQPVLVGKLESIDEASQAESLAVLQDFEQQYRQELPGPPPGFYQVAALWAATSIYYAATLTVHRDIGEDEVSRILDVSPPPRDQAEVHYSVDLTMRFLPDLIKLAKSTSANDPLIVWLNRWASNWPLSSVGIASVDSVDVLPLRSSMTLMRLYADRIIATNDGGRLKDPTVAELVRAAIGDYPDLSPILARELDKSD